MKEFTMKTFNRLLNLVDEENTYDFETFVEGIMDLQENLSDNDVDEIIEFIVDEYDVTCDAEVHNITSKDAKVICDFINDLMGANEEDY